MAVTGHGSEYMARYDRDTLWPRAGTTVKKFDRRQGPLMAVPYFTRMERRRNSSLPPTATGDAAYICWAASRVGPQWRIRRPMTMFRPRRLGDRDRLRELRNEF